MQSHTSLKGMGPLLLEQIYMKKEIHILWRHCMVHVGGEYPFIQPLFLYTPWRVGTAREEKGWGQCFFRQIEPNGPLPYSTVPAPRLRDASQRAGSPIAVYARVQCRDPKTGQEKVQFYCKYDSLFLSSYYLSMVHTLGEEESLPSSK